MSKRIDALWRRAVRQRNAAHGHVRFALDLHALLENTQGYTREQVQEALEAIEVHLDAELSAFVALTDAAEQETMNSIPEEPVDDGAFSRKPVAEA